MIVFSVGYGHDAKGAFPMNFGPLNKDGGQRRLNVAVTRARERVEVVASVRARDFTLSESASAGARLLRDYVAYAESGGRWDGDRRRVGRARMAVTARGAGRAGDRGARLRRGPRRRRRQPSASTSACRQPAPRALPAGHRVRRRAATPRRRRRATASGCATRCSASSAGARSTASGRWTGCATARARSSAYARPSRPLRRTSRPSRKPARRTAAPDAGGRSRERVERVVPELDGSAAAAAAAVDAGLRPGAARDANPLTTSSTRRVNRREQTDMLVELVTRRGADQHRLRDPPAGEGVGAWPRGASSRLRGAPGGQSGVASRSTAGSRRVPLAPGPDPHDVRIPDPDDPDTRREIEEIPPEEIDLAIARLSEQSPGIDRRPADRPGRASARLRPRRRAHPGHAGHPGRRHAQVGERCRIA